MTNRQRRRLLVTAGTVIIGLLPLLLSIAASYWQAVRDADQRRQNYAAVAVKRIDQIFGAADTTLRTLATQIDPQCNAKTQAALLKAAYESLYFHSAGLIYNGALQCSIDGSAIALRHADQLPAPGTAIRIAAPGTMLPNNPSILALYSVQKDLALSLSINPMQLGETLWSLLEGQEAAVRIVGQDGNNLAQFGWRFDEQHGQARGLQSTAMSSRYFPVDVVATTSQAWLLQAWAHSVPLFASVGLAISALLFFLSNKLVLRQFSLDAELRDAFANDEFQVYYQPVIDVNSGLCIGAEALLRWQHPHRGLVMPDSFFSIAEKTGFAVPLTAWVMERVAEEMSSLLTAHPEFHISLNLSARHILDPNLLGTIRKTFKGGIPPQRIIFEITEQELLRGDHSALLAVVQDLRDTGARLALDDFGTGYSSLKYLTQFRFDYLKIDKVFIQAIGTDPVTAGLVDVIVDIAKRLHLQVIAEGIETTEQLGYVKRLNVRMVQGWLFSKALPAPLFRTYVNRRQADLAAVGTLNVARQ